MLRVAVVGVGWAGSEHVRAARDLERAGVRKLEIACLVDSDPDHLRARAAELGVPRTYPDLLHALADPGVDAVDICAPHPLHAPMAVAAAAAGKHVLVEKPMATTVDEASRMIAAAEAGGVRLMVAENEPYSVRARMLRRLVATGEYTGEVTCAALARGGRMPRFMYPGRRDWLGLPAKGGTGTWMLHGVHSMADLRFVLGEVETVYMVEHKAASFERRDLEGTMVGLLTLAGGVGVTVVQTAETRLGDAFTGYVIHGDRGTLRATWTHCEAHGAGGADGTGGGGAPRVLAYPEEPLDEYARELEAFADYVATGAEPPTTGRSERRSLAVVQAGAESAQHGRPVVLRERFGEL